MATTFSLDRMDVYLRIRKHTRIEVQLRDSNETGKKKGVDVTTEFDSFLVQF